MAALTYAAAINRALAEEMERDPSVVLYGEDVSHGLFGVTSGLRDRFGDDRVFDSPISENVIVGSGVGAAMMGMRPVVELQFADFIFTAADEVFLKAGMWRYMHGGAYTIPLVIRAASGGGGFGPEHSACPEAFVMHSPGLLLAVPSTPEDAYGLLRTAIREDNPVVFLEHKSLYGTRGEVADEAEPVPFGKARVRRQGDALTVVAWQNMLVRVMNVAERLAGEGIEIEVVDPLTLNPFDRETILESVRKTGACMVVEEAYRTLGVGAEIGAMLFEEAFGYLDRPFRRLAIPDVPLPTARHLFAGIVPAEDDIYREAKALVNE